MTRSCSKGCFQTAKELFLICQEFFFNLPRRYFFSDEELFFLTNKDSFSAWQGPILSLKKSCFVSDKELFCL